MKKVGNMELIDFEEVLDKRIGKIGTPARDDFEHQVEEAVHAAEIGAAVKKRVQCSISLNNSWANELA